MPRESRAPPASSMRELAFPLWQIDPDEYRAVCAYLRLTPEMRLYERLSRYLAEAAFRFPRPDGFSRHLARGRLTRFRIGRLDPTTKLFLPGHPLRHVLNGVVALHECDSRGYRELADVEVGRHAWLALLGVGLRYGANLAISLPWLAWQWLGYAAAAPFRSAPALAGSRVLITGVNRGLGRDLMLHCLESGAEVIGIVRSSASRDALHSELPAPARVTLLVADLSVPGALQAALREAGIDAGTIAIAVLSAGIKHDGRSVLSSSDVRETFEVNFFAAVELSEWLCGAPATGSTTRIVLISSMGRWHGMHRSGGYNASKAALSIWGESLDLELRQSNPKRFTVTVVEPGLFASGMTARVPLARMLFASRRKVAARILAGACAGRAVIRPPGWFALLTWGVCLLGRGFRARAFASARPPEAH